MKMFEIDFRRYWLPLFMLYELKEIVTAAKFQKLAFLIHVEGKIDVGYDFVKHHYGPYSEELKVDSAVLARNGLIALEETVGMKRKYYVYREKPKGRELFEQFKDILPKEKLDVASNVLEKYGKWGYEEIIEYVYENYVITTKEFKERCSRIKMDTKRVFDFWLPLYDPECLAATYFLGMVDYINATMKKIETCGEPVIRGVCLATISETLGKMITLTSIADEYERILEFEPQIMEIMEYFHFLGNYCHKKGILPLISELDFSEVLDEEEVERLEKEFQKTEP